MNEEIKILRAWQILEYVDTREHLEELFNYITNLQKENEELKKKIDLYEAILEERNSTIDYYKSNNEKSIEYIKSNYIDNPIEFKKDLLKILKGSDKDENN